MKKMIVAVAVVSVFSATAVFAGTYGHMMLGATAGLNIAKFYGDDMEGFPVEKVESISGFCGGAFVEVPINQMISFQPELLYSMKGSKETINGEGGIIGQTFNFSYLEIPMLFKAYLPRAAAVRPYLCFGPAVAFRVSATREWRDRSTGETFEEHIEEDTSTTDVGLLFGAGLAFPAMTHTFSLEARYDLGLTTTDEDDHVDIKNGVFSVLAGIAF